MTPQGHDGPTLTAERLERYATTNGKRVLASWMGGAEVASGKTILNRLSLAFPSLFGVVLKESDYDLASFFLEKGRSHLDKTPQENRQR